MMVRGASVYRPKISIVWEGFRRGQRNFVLFSRFGPLFWTIPGAQRRRSAGSGAPAGRGYGNNPNSV